MTWRSRTGSSRSASTRSVASRTRRSLAGSSMERYGITRLSQRSFGQLSWSRASKPPARPKGHKQFYPCPSPLGHNHWMSCAYRAKCLSPTKSSRTCWLARLPSWMISAGCSRRPARVSPKARRSARSSRRIPKPGLICPVNHRHGHHQPADVYASVPDVADKNVEHLGHPVSGGS